MTDDEKLDRDLAALSAVYHEAGLKAGEEVGKKPRTPERQAKVDAMLERARESVRAAREQAVADLLEEQPQQEARPIPARILAMAREVVIERLRALTQGTGEGTLQPAVQFRKLDELSTPDLQRILADVEEQLGTDSE